jgi:hypothetical protein
MKTTNIFYWIFTGLLAALMLFSAIGGLKGGPDSDTLMKHLGYAHYVLPFLSVLKILGVVAILVPGFPRIREWAYAGFFFDLAGATYSFISVGDPPGAWLPMLIGFVLLFGSYLLYHKRLKNA